MRLDKFLKVSRIIKRRQVAKEACDSGRVSVNDKIAKAGTDLKVGDTVCVSFGNKELKFKVSSIVENPSKAESSDLYNLI